MRNRFLTRVTVMAIVACVAAAVTLVTAQTPAYRAPRAPDGKPNLNGIWSSGLRAQSPAVSVSWKGVPFRIVLKRSPREMRTVRTA
jgi:hypothetical protein